MRGAAISSYQVWEIELINSKFERQSNQVDVGGNLFLKEARSIFIDRCYFHNNFNSYFGAVIFLLLII